MFERLRLYSVQVVAIFLIAISSVLMQASLDNPSLMRFGTGSIQLALSPFFSWHSSLSQYFGDFFAHYLWLQNVAEDKEQLEQELELLRLENSRLREVYAEAQSLRDLLNYKESSAKDAVLAMVVARNPSNWARTITINRGRKDGLRRGMAVVASDAAVGQVVSVSKNVSEVLLLTDHLSAIDALVQDSRIAGIVEGNGARDLSLNYVIKFKDYLIQAGQTVVTSGLDGVFPKGIVIGSVDEVDAEAKGLFQKIRLKPQVDLLRLEHVLVLSSGYGKTDQRGGSDD